MDAVIFYGVLQVNIFAVIFHYALQVYVFDIMDVEANLDTLEFLGQLYEHTTPIRIGLLPIGHQEESLMGSEPGDLLAKIFYHLVEEKDGPYALKKLT